MLSEYVANGEVVPAENVESKHPLHGAPELLKNCTLLFWKGNVCVWPYAKTPIKQARNRAKEKRGLFFIDLRGILVGLERTYMFIAGIEIFFGLVAGAVLLVLMSSAIFFTFAWLTKIIRSYCRWYDQRRDAMYRKNAQIVAKATAP